MKIQSILVLALVVLLCDSITVNAQSMTVIGGESMARDCFMSASVAAKMHIASNDAIENCTYALEKTNLSLRDKVATFINRGVIYVAMEKYPAAVKDYEKARRIAPNTGELYVNRGNLLFISGVYDQAVQEYSKALELEISKGQIAYFNRGMAYEKLGEINKAEADYRKAMELAPDWRDPKNKLELLLLKNS